METKQMANETDINFKGLPEETTIKDLNKMEQDIKGFKFNYSKKEKAIKEIEKENQEKKETDNYKEIMGGLGIEVY